MTQKTLTALAAIQKYGWSALVKTMYENLSQDERASLKQAMEFPQQSLFALAA